MKWVNGLYMFPEHSYKDRNGKVIIAYGPVDGHLCISRPDADGWRPIPEFL
jgi:hypothetical protein